MSSKTNEGILLVGNYGTDGSTIYYVDSTSCWPYSFYVLDLGLKTYNPETHELVEKKEAKIARLEKEIDEKQKLSLGIAESVKYYQDLEKKVLEELYNTREELKKIKE